MDCNTLLPGRFVPHTDLIHRWCVCVHTSRGAKEFAEGLHVRRAVAYHTDLHATQNLHANQPCAAGSTPSKLPLPPRPDTRALRPLDGPYLLVRVHVRPEHDRFQSCAIALRSPASERPSDLKPNSTEFFVVRDHRSLYTYLPFDHSLRRRAR